MACAGVGLEARVRLGSSAPHDSSFNRRAQVASATYLMLELMLKLKYGAHACVIPYARWECAESGAWVVSTTANDPCSSSGGP